MCNKRETRDQCERSSSCHFVSDGDVDVDCVVDSTTIEPGCCYGNPDAAYNKKWMETCTAYFTERECLVMTDDYDECILTTTTTTTTTTTEEPGCCKGDSA